RVGCVKLSFARWWRSLAGEGASRPGWLPGPGSPLAWQEQAPKRQPLAPDLLRVAADRFEANHADDVVSTSPAFAGIDTAPHSFTTSERALFICESDEAQRAAHRPANKMARQFEKCGNGGPIVIRARRVLVRVVVRTNDDDLVFVLPPRKLGADIEEGFVMGS